MKYLKQFESDDIAYVGDYIVLLSIDYADIENKINVGDIYEVIDYEEDAAVQYEIINADGYPNWLYATQVRKATPEEINIKKYNL